MEESEENAKTAQKKTGRTTKLECGSQLRIGQIKITVIGKRAIKQVGLDIEVLRSYSEQRGQG